MNFVELTLKEKNEKMFVNLFNVTTLSRRDDGTDIWFIGEEDSITVAETPTEILALRRAGASL